MTNATQRGRNHLRDWLDDKPDNFYTYDTNFQRVLRRYDALTQGFEARLTEFGGLCAATIDEAAKIEDRVGNHPRLERWTGIGERIEQVEFHPNHDVIGRLVWESGITAVQAEPGRNVQQNALFYLLNHNGEAGHACALACTFGLIRALQRVGSAEVRERFLPPLLRSDYEAMQHGAQFLTEVQGGSDVGANAVIAEPAEDGTWRISGEKWFCSNINADQFLMTARPADAQEGTRGLGLFVVPRLLPDGTTNGFYMRRLKEKLGTRTLASAELDFVEAVAYPVGPIEDGFKNAVSLVLNTSRLVNATACAAIMQRAFIEAAHYAKHRRAFDHPIITYPLVQEALADICTEAAAAVASTFALAHLLDGIETGQGTDADAAAFRMLVNINKYITSIRGTEQVHRAIEVLGGNGAIESFSILPRLYRDLIVLESWEGTHNVLCLQVMRDCARYKIHKPFAAFLRAQMSGAEGDLSTYAQRVDAALEQGIAQLEALIAGDAMHAQAHIRRVVDWLAATAQAAILIGEAQWEREQGETTDKTDIIAYFVNRRLTPGYDPMTDDEWLPRLRRLTIEGRAVPTPPRG